MADSPLAEALSGALGATISSAAIFPLDSVTTRLQTSGKRSRRGLLKEILRREGFSGLLQGILPDSLSTFISSFIFFFVYSALRTRLLTRRTRQALKLQTLLTPLEEIALGCCAGIISKGFVAPLSNITVRMQTVESEKKGGNDKNTSDSDDSDDEENGFSGFYDIARQIYHERGIAGLWSGFPASILLTTNPSIALYVGELLQRALIPVEHQSHPRAGQTFITSALASAIASFLTYPLILTKTLMQSRSKGGSNLLETMIKIVRTNGVAGLYKGLSAQLIKGFFEKGLGMTLKERLNLALLLLHRRVTRRTVTS